MPLSINVGLSRKASKDYQSTGVSINVTAELDQSLLAKPAELQRQINGLYDQARQALDTQTEPPGEVPRPRAADNGGRTARNPATNGNSATNGNGSRATSPMTASQRRAITAIASRLGVDADTEARQIIGVEFDQLSLRQASELIDALKAQADAPAAR